MGNSACKAFDRRSPAGHTLRSAELIDRIGRSASALRGKHMNLLAFSFAAADRITSHLTADGTIVAMKFMVSHDGS
jgi:hypothetical protein